MCCTKYVSANYNLDYRANAKHKHGGNSVGDKFAKCPSQRHTTIAADRKLAPSMH